MGFFSTSICLFLPILAPKLAQASRPMGPAKLFWAGGWSDHPSPSLHSKIFEKSKIDIPNWYLYSETLCCVKQSLKARSLFKLIFGT